MYRHVPVLVLAFLLFSLLAARDASARPLQGTSPNTSSNQEIKFHQESQGDEAIVADEDRCDGISDEDECLMRRSLAAHVDYIYTQKNDKP